MEVAHDPRDETGIGYAHEELAHDLEGVPDQQRVDLYLFFLFIHLLQNNTFNRMLKFTWKLIFFNCMCVYKYSHSDLYVKL